MAARLHRWIERFFAWQDRRRQRRELLGLGAAALKDMGLSRCDAERWAERGTGFGYRIEP